MKTFSALALGVLFTLGLAPHLNAAPQFGQRSGVRVGTDTGRFTYTPTHTAFYAGKTSLPGGTVTEQLANVDPAIVEKSRQETPSGRLTTAEEVARLIVFLGSDGNGNVNGEVIHTAGHTAGSVSLYCADLEAVFTGDALLASGSFGCWARNVRKAFSASP